jgi:hypothetical protein
MKPLAFLIVAALPLTASAAERSTIPPAYRGDWASSVAACAPGPQNIENIRVGARFIQEFETRLDVRSVTRVRKNEIIAGGRLSYSAAIDPTAIYDSGTRLVLLEGGKELGVGEGEDFGTYVRCKP